MFQKCWLHGLVEIQKKQKKRQQETKNGNDSFLGILCDLSHCLNALPAFVEPKFNEII